MKTFRFGFDRRNGRRAVLGAAACGLIFSAAATAAAATAAQPAASASAPAPRGAAVKTLFIGNSFLYAAGSPVRVYRPETVTDLNGEGVGGVPAVFKAMTVQAGLRYDVSHELVGGAGLDLHLEKKAGLVVRPWDLVVMHGFSLLDRAKPGDGALLARTVKEMAGRLHAERATVDIRLMATWSRADQVYPENGHWHGQPIEAMARDIRGAYDRAAAGTPFVRGVIPVGEAWNRAMRTGIADPNPYDGIAFNQMDLWTYDHYHGSTFGYYLEALTIFGAVTGLDPRALGANDKVGFELGLSSQQAGALQQIAYDELMAGAERRELKKFQPPAAPKKS